MATNIPENLSYTPEHEWIKIEENIGIVGITDFAQSSLGDIVFAELPAKGTLLVQGKSFGVVESIKSVSDLYSPLSGEVIERNEDVQRQPDLINSNAYNAWLIKIKFSNKSELSQLLNSKDYSKLCH